MSGDGSDSPALIQGATPSTTANGVLLSCACSASNNAAFNKGYQNLSNFSAATATYAPESYDATNTIIAAMKALLTQHKAITRANLVTQLHKITFKGITKVVKFQKNGNIAGSAIYVNKVENGKIVQLGLE